MNARVVHDRYELHETLGGGSGSTTFLATDRETGDRCVVKELSVGEVIQADTGTHSFDGDNFTKLVELFEREAAVLAGLDHPAIPSFIDHFSLEVDGDTRLYTVQEHVEGETLESLVAKGTVFSEDQARDICEQVASVLEYLHGFSPPLIHRDIKPSNVIRDASGGIHLVDFGAVRNTAGSELDGKTIVGTYGYMPIEQYEARAVPQSDLYALGMTLVFILSRKAPPEIGRSGIKLDFRPHVNVSDDFGSLIERLIEAAPEDRPASATAVLQSLKGGALAAVGADDVVPWGWAQSLKVIAMSPAGAVGIIAIIAILLRLLASPGGAPMASVSPAGDSPAIADLDLIPPPVNGVVVEPVPPIVPVRPEGDQLRIDLYDDFRYIPTGWPMGWSVSQTSLQTLSEYPVEAVHVPVAWRNEGAEVRFGFFHLGNREDSQISFALVRDHAGWALYVDKNNNNDLMDDGPPRYNEGSGKLLAANVTVEIEVEGQFGDVVRHPYDLWVWFDGPRGDGTVTGRFYPKNHFRGAIEVGGRTIDAVAFEYRGHDGLYKQSGVCIDLNGDGDCAETSELFFDGTTVRIGGSSYRLFLNYP